MAKKKKKNAAFFFLKALLRVCEFKKKKCDRVPHLQL